MKWWGHPGLVPVTLAIINVLCMVAVLWVLVHDPPRSLEPRCIALLSVADYEQYGGSVMLGEEFYLCGDNMRYQLLPDGDIYNKKKETTH